MSEPNDTDPTPNDGDNGDGNTQPGDDNAEASNEAAPSETTDEVPTSNPIPEEERQPETMEASVANPNETDQKNDEVPVSNPDENVQKIASEEVPVAASNPTLDEVGDKATQEEVTVPANPAAEEASSFGAYTQPSSVSSVKDQSHPQSSTTLPSGLVGMPQSDPSTEIEKPGGMALVQFNECKCRGNESKAAQPQEDQSSKTNGYGDDPTCCDEGIIVGGPEKQYIKCLGREILQVGRQLFTEFGTNVKDACVSGNPKINPGEQAEACPCPGSRPGGEGCPCSCTDLGSKPSEGRKSGSKPSQKGCCQQETIKDPCAPPPDPNAEAIAELRKIVDHLMLRLCLLECKLPELENYTKALMTTVTTHNTDQTCKLQCLEQDTLRLAKLVHELQCEVRVQMHFGRMGCCDDKSKSPQNSGAMEQQKSEEPPKTEASNKTKDDGSESQRSRAIMDAKGPIVIPWHPCPSRTESEEEQDHHGLGRQPNKKKLVKLPAESLSEKLT